MTKYRFKDIAYNSTEKKKPTKEDKYTYIGLEHLDPQCLEVTRFGSEVAPIGEKLIMRKGDVLFGKRRAYQKKVAIAPFNGIFSAHGLVLRPKENVVDPKFFPMFIASDYFLDAAIKISVGSLSPTINWSALKELEFELPDLEKQRELAELLWAAEETKQSYKSFICIANKIINSYFVKIQKRNTTLSFNDIFNDDTKNATKIDKNNYLENGKFKIIDQSQYEIAGYSNNEEGLYKDTPAIIFGDHTRVFKFINEPFFLGADGTKLLKLKNKDIDYTYIYYYLKNLKLTNLGYNRHFKLLKEIKFFIPDIKIQKQYASFIKKINIMINSLNVQIENLSYIQKIILEKALREEVSDV